MAMCTKTTGRSDAFDYGFGVSSACELAVPCLPLWAQVFCQDGDFVFEEATKRFDLVFSTLKTGRSLAASYTLQSDIQCTPLLSRRPFFILIAKIHVVVFVQVQTEEDQALFSSQVPTIVSLTKGCKSATVVRDPSQIPAGCASAVVNPTVIIHTLVRVRKSI
jgi:valyl-tRNA synthetase